jgi:hypothetical protein
MLNAYRDNDLRKRWCQWSGVNSPDHRHWNMVPFDRLDDFIRGLDRVCIAVMAAWGFDGGGE